MITYYLDLARRSLLRTKVLTALMVLAIALGIGASMTMLTVLHVLTADPLPGRSANLFYPQLDPRGMDGYTPGDKPPNQLSWIDAMNLLHDRRGTHQAAMAGGWVMVRPPQGDAHAFFAPARYTSADFFTMFKVPILHGRAWSANDDEDHAQVAVIGRHMAEKLYGSDQAVGKLLHLGKDFFRIVGVMRDWRPTPQFYDVSVGPYADTAQIFLPLQTAMALKQPRRGSMSCWGHADFRDMTKAPCGWLQYWVQLDSPAQASAYRQYLVNYSKEQKALGRYQRPPNVALHDLMGWLAYKHVLPGSVQLQTLLALGFLLVCLINTVALLLVKFLRRGGELGVRRAMGASRGSIFLQLLVEAGLLGIGAGLAGMGLAAFGLWVVREQPLAYADVARLDVPMLLATLVLALASALLSAVFPAWRACRLPPARVLKVQ